MELKKTDNLLEILKALLQLEELIQKSLINKENNLQDQNQLKM